MDRVIRIGTRDSELALWQAKRVQLLLKRKGFASELVPVKSTGDLILDKPLYELGITGIFTKTLDIAMLNGEVDVAVHSMKDVPTQLPKGIVEAAVLRRAATNDVLVTKNFHYKQLEGTIATGSLRRKAQWLHKYPGFNVVDLRGNVNTRLQKLEDSNWQGAVFAAAGLERLNLFPEVDDYEEDEDEGEYRTITPPVNKTRVFDLDWMTPAPAQGAMLVVAMENDSYCKDALALLNYKPAQQCVHLEREFLKTLEGGCTAPIGALATIKSKEVTFEGALFSLDGKERLAVTDTFPVSEIKGKGAFYAQHLLNNGGAELMKEIKKVLDK